MAAELFQNFSDAAAFAKRKAQESGVSVRLLRDGAAWAVDVLKSNEPTHVRQGSLQTIREPQSTAEAESPQSEQVDFYKITTDSLKAIIASNFVGLSNNQIMIIYNQEDRHSLTEEERQSLEDKYKAVKPTKSWSPSNAFGVYAATDGQD